MKLSTFMLSLLASYTVAYQGEICSDDPVSASYVLFPDWELPINEQSNTDSVAK